jgi:hypothetical protein
LVLQIVCAPLNPSTSATTENDKHYSSIAPLLLQYEEIMNYAPSLLQYEEIMNYHLKPDLYSSKSALTVTLRVLFLNIFFAKFTFI